MELIPRFVSERADLGGERGVLALSTEPLAEVLHGEGPVGSLACEGEEVIFFGEGELQEGLHTPKTPQDALRFHRATQIPTCRAMSW